MNLPHLSPRRRWVLTAIMASLLSSAGRTQEIPPELKGSDAPSGSIWADTLDLSRAEQGFGKTQAGKTPDSHPLTLKGTVYPRGLGTHAVARLLIDLHGTATRFKSVVGIDDEVGKKGAVVFSLWVDGTRMAQSDILHGGGDPQLISADLTGAKLLMLVVEATEQDNQNCHADWAGAAITLTPGSQNPETLAISEPPRLKILPDDSQTAIHGPRVVGTTPGYPFLFSIPATGTSPLNYSAENLPAGLMLDENTGIISGFLQQAGITRVALTVKGPGGLAQRNLTITGGDHKLAQTPPMGWNSWNVWGTTVDKSKVSAAADQMIAAGLAAHGYQYINIDDGWQVKDGSPNPRDADGHILSNSHFPDMKGLADAVHAKGLRIGIYSSPGKSTCGRYAGSYEHEDLDAQSYADWGFDYLKYDWCTYEDICHGDHSLSSLQKPYQVMRASMDKVKRDIVFSLCQYGWGDVWKWGSQPGIFGNSWRTHDDVDDFWYGRRGVYDIIESEVGHDPYAGPGHWNDPDMLMVGIVGIGYPHPTRLTPNEQIVHLSMWCMFSSPILIGCDLTRLDTFTRALLTNDELLDIDQDPLGKTAGRVRKDKDLGEIWSRPLFDGTYAVSLLNPSPVSQTLTVQWSELGLSGSQPVRDLWLHQDLGSLEDSYSVKLPSHGVAVLKVGTAKKED